MKFNCLMFDVYSYSMGQRRGNIKTHHTKINSINDACTENSFKNNENVPGKFLHFWLKNLQFCCSAHWSTYQQETAFEKKKALPLYHVYRFYKMVTYYYVVFISLPAHSYFVHYKYASLVHYVLVTFFFTTKIRI